MRADRVISLVLLLRRHGRMTAEALAGELEVSRRTVMRDVEALSVAGVPIYAERGRYGGFALLPDFRTELAGLTHDEALALLTAGAGRGEQAFGLGPALASAMRKVVHALPEHHRASASDGARRFLVEPATDLLSRRAPAEEVPGAVMAAVRRAVLAGRRLRLHYAATDQAPRWRLVDPVGLVTVRERTYLLATRAGEDRTYRLARVHDVEELDEPAERPAGVDLDRLWQERCARFLSGSELPVLVRVVPARREELLEAALAVRAEEPDAAPGADGRVPLEVTFQDARHARWALWRLGPDAEVVAPVSLRAALRERAAAMAAGYA